MRIAVCDDELLQLARLRSTLEDYCRENGYLAEIFCYTNPSDLVDQIERGNCCDIYILDVYLPGMNGISIAQTMRRSGIEASVIFLTASPDFALEAYSVNAVQYLIKPCSEEAIRAALDEAVLRSIMIRKRYAVFKENGAFTSVAVQDILFARANGNYQTMHLSDGRTITVRMTASELLETLAEYSCFMRCDKSHIVNLNNVRSLGPKACLMTDGSEIPVSRKLYPSLKDGFFDFFSRLDAGF